MSPTWSMLSVSSFVSHPFFFLFSRLLLLDVLGCVFSFELLPMRGRFIIFPMRGRFIFDGGMDRLFYSLIFSLVMNIFSN